ncbi:MAG: FecR domain-containing protein [Chloroflexota bacterium]|nr:MAG: FecR domain-containing protein [Chloroflexota bacterium]
MSNQDDKLQERLTALEEGKEPDRNAAENNNSSELSSLVRLAASIRDLPHPELDGGTVQSEKRRMISAAREKGSYRRNQKPAKPGGFTGLWLFVPSVAGVALLVMMVFIIAAGAGLYFSGPRGAQAAVLSDAVGVLEISDSGFAGDWHPIAAGAKVQSGQRLRTGENSQVTLEFYDGTQVTLRSNTDVVVSKVAGDWGKVLQVELIQNGGETYHQVVPLQGDGASYQVYTPSGEASVKGTSFSVLVEDTGISHFAVETGEVLVNNEGTETFVSAGKSIVTQVGVPMASAHYNFTLTGEVTGQSGKTWTVAGVNFLVTDDTWLLGDPGLGDTVEVHGRIKKQGDWLADTVEKLDEPVDAGGVYTGVVTDQGDTSWTIAGLEIQLGGSFPDIVVGDLVRVTFELTADGKLATNIELLGSDDEEDPDDEPEPEDEVQQGLVFELGDYDPSACETVPSPTFKLWYYTDALEGITFEKFDYEVTEGDAFIVAGGVEFEPAGPFTINPGESIEVTVKITLTGDPALLPPGGEVKIKVFPVLPAGFEDLEVGELVIYLKCEDEAEDEEKPKEGFYCTNDAQHPKALKLVEEYKDEPMFAGLDLYEMIMDWFCNYRYGFGEIDLMLGLSVKYELPVEEVFSLRQSGLGWGQIKRQLANDAVVDDLGTADGKKIPPGKQKSEDAKNKEKPNKKKDE